MHNLRLLIQKQLEEYTVRCGTKTMKTKDVDREVDLIINYADKKYY